MALHSVRHLMRSAIGFSAVVAWAAAALAQPAGSFNVRDYGAAGNGRTNDTASLNRAVEACSRSGGGTVRVPPGTYLTGTVLLQSHVTLQLDGGATLRGIDQLDQYQTTSPGDDWFSSIVQAKGAENIAVIGHGIIDGAKVFNPRGEERMRGPHALLFEDSRNIVIRDVIFRDAANFAVVLQSSENADIDGISVFGGWDGIHMRDSRDVTIANSRFFTRRRLPVRVPVEERRRFQLHSEYFLQRIPYRRPAHQGQPSSDLRPPGNTNTAPPTAHNLEAGFRLWPHAERPEKNGPFVVRRRLNEMGPIDDITLTDITLVNARTPLWLDPGSEGDGLGRIVVRNLTATGTGATPVFVAGRASNPVGSIVFDGADIEFNGGNRRTGSAATGAEPVLDLSRPGLLAEPCQRRATAQSAHPLRRNGSTSGAGGSRRRPSDRGCGCTGRKPSMLPRLVLQRSGVSIDGQAPRPTEACISKVDLGDYGTLTAGDRFTVSVEARNCGTGTLAEVPLRLGASEQIEHVVLQPGATARVRFSDLKAQAGEWTVQSGQVARTITVAAAPVAATPAAPWRTFSNTPSDIQQRGELFYLRSENHDPMDRSDRYAALYRESSLGPSGTITVRLDNPELRSGWGGRAGVIVRDGMANGGAGKGYLVLAASPANGCTLEWDSNGDGLVDQRSEPAGYTYWPTWLRLERRGNRYIGSWSKDGSNWIVVGTAQVDTPGALDAGMFVSGSAATFRGFRIESAAERERP